MTIFSVKLKHRKEVAYGTMAFYLEKPAGFVFKAGQFMVVTLMDPPETDVEGNTRTFSIASAPYEGDLMIATRMRDTAFKRVLRTMPLGRSVQIQGPYGSLVLHTDAARPAVFLAGGIGITPFRSILLQATKNTLPQPLFLFYSNRRPEDAAFLEELHTLEKENPRYKWVGTMTNMRDSQRVWSGETGFISKKMLEQFIDDLTAPIYYIAGPPAMVKVVRKMIEEAGVPEDNIRAEEFAGYE